MAGYEEEYHAKVHEGRIKNTLIYEMDAQRAKREYLGIAKNGDRILEYGCGVGQNIYLSEGAIGYDISSYALEFCRSKGIATVGDLDKIEDGSLDIILCSHVLEHVDRPFDTLREMGRKLKKGGRVVLVLPLEAQGRSSFDLDTHQHLYAWTFRTINNLLCKTGFRPVENKTLSIPTGKKKLLPVSRIHPKIYELATFLAGAILGYRELRIVAIKNTG